MQALRRHYISNLSLELRTSLGALLLIIIASGILLYQLYHQQRNQLLNESLEQLKNNIYLNQTRIQLTLDNLERDVHFLARVPALQGIIRATLNNGLDPQNNIPIQSWNAHLTQLAKAFVEARPAYFQIRYISASDMGRELVKISVENGQVSVTPPDKLQTKGDRDYFIATLKLKPGEVYLSDLNLNQEYGKIEVPHRRTLRATTPVFLSDGKIFGIVVINMDISPLLDRMTTGLPPAVNVYLTNTNGDYILHHNPDRTFGFDLGHRYIWQQDFPDLVTQDNVENLNVASMRTNDATHELIHIVSHKVYFDKLKPARFLLLFNTLPDAEISNKTQRIFGVNIIMMAAGMLIIIVLVLLAIRRMFAPFGHLIEAANSIAAGDYEKKLPTYKTSDMGKLVLAFNDMQQQIKFRENAITQLNADLEHRVEQRTLELSQANQELESFAYAVSHDLRAPLRAMSGFSQALEEDYADQLQAEARDYLQQIVIASHKMSELIDGLLLLSRCTRGDLRFDLIDLSALALRLLDDLAKQSPARQVAINVEKDINVYGDVRMIEVVMCNLLENAWKYTAHTPQATIHVHAKVQDDKDYICVTDNGAGFNNSHTNRLFQPFQRLHRQDEFPGIGVGLATVQRIVHRHGGIINGQGEPGKGACFCFSLPNRKSDSSVTVMRRQNEYQCNPVS